MEALLEAAAFEDLPGKWQAAILKSEQNRPRVRIVWQRLKPLSLFVRPGTLRA